MVSYFYSAEYTDIFACLKTVCVSCLALSNPLTRLVLNVSGICLTNTLGALLCFVLSDVLLQLDFVHYVSYAIYRITS